LARLIRCAYTHIRPEDDQVHEGAYTPDQRDRAETARNFLLGALTDTPGYEAQKEMLSLAKDPSFRHFPDRLRLLARRRAAEDAEPPPLRPEQVVALERQHESPPYDRDGLFEIMLRRIEDLQEDIAHHDFSNRRTLRTIRDEIEMQRTLARSLLHMSRGAYNVIREDEVADGKQTDIRLLAMKGEQKAVIEVKIADRRWSMIDLERARKAQLVGQYLRHSTCKVGCLLLTYDGTKKFWKRSRTGRRLNFQQLLDHLADLAQTIEGELRYEVRIAVRGLDLTDTPLEPAHL
jgi:hypothetical protein